MCHTTCSIVLLLSLLASCSLAQSHCFYRDGSDAWDDDYEQCPGQNWCCKRSDTCAYNGLCIDIDNHPDGSLTDLVSGTFNFTGLYQTTACTDPDWSGCATECSSADADDTAYVWSCNDDLTEYCCLGNGPIGPHRYCCQDNNQFMLDAGKLIAWNATATTTTSTTSTSSPTTLTSSSWIPSSTSQPRTGSEDLSSGAKIGIAVGVALGIIAISIIALLAFCHRKRSRRLRDNPDPAHPGGRRTAVTSDHRSVEQIQHVPVYGAASKPHHELGVEEDAEVAHPPRAELQGNFDQGRTSWRRTEMLG